MRTTDKKVMALFEQFIKSINGEIASSYKDVGKYMLDHNDQGYQIVMIDNAQGGENLPFGMRRFKPAELCDLMQFAINSLTIALLASTNNTDYQNYITCPHCGHKDKDSWRKPDDLPSMMCGSCGKLFSMTHDQFTTYTTRKLHEVK